MSDTLEQMGGGAVADVSGAAWTDRYTHAVMDTFGPPQRVLVRVPLGPAGELGRALKAAAVARVARRDDLPLRIQVDPVAVG